MNRPPVKSMTPLALVLAAAALTACGGGGDSSSSAGGGTLTVTAANPATHNTTMDVSKAPTKGNDARAADTFSATPYCDVYFEGYAGANGTTYALQVYFRQTDKAPLNASLVGGSGASMWVVFSNNAGSPITGITVDTAARTITFANKVLTGNSGETATVNGTVSFPVNATGTAGCGV